MKVYVITAGEYSEYHIERVFLDKEKAYRFAAVNRHIAAINNYRVEEYDCDDDNIETNNKTKVYRSYRYYICRDEEICIFQTGEYTLEPYFTMETSPHYEWIGEITIECKKGEEISEQQVKKTIAEKVAKKKAEQLGL